MPCTYILLYTYMYILVYIWGIWGSIGIRRTSICMNECVHLSRLPRCSQKFARTNLGHNNTKARRGFQFGSWIVCTAVYHEVIKWACGTFFAIFAINFFSKLFCCSKSLKKASGAKQKQSELLSVCIDAVNWAALQ